MNIFEFGFHFIR